MRQTWRKTGILICCLALVMSLAACGSKNYIGSWYAGSSEQLILIMKEDGHLTKYDTFFQNVVEGSWEKTRDGVYVTFEDTEMDLLDKGNDTLEGQLTFTRGEDFTVPKIGLYQLNLYEWRDPETSDYLEFYQDGSWEIFDWENGDTAQSGGPDSIENVGDVITLTSLDGEVLTLKVSEDAMELACSNGQTFVNVSLQSDDETAEAAE